MLGFKSKNAVFKLVGRLEEANVLRRDDKGQADSPLVEECHEASWHRRGRMAESRRRGASGHHLPR